MAGESSCKVRERDVLFLASWIETRMKSQGTVTLIKCLKSIRNHVTKYIAGEPVIISDMRLGITKDGIPKALGPLVPILRNREPQDLRMILTILSIGRLVLGNGDLDLTSIVSPCTGDPNKIDEITQECRLKLKNAYPNIITRINSEQSTYWSKPHLTTKNGPNGHALDTSLFELGSMTKPMLTSIVVLGGARLLDYIKEIMPIARAMVKSSRFKDKKPL